VQISILLFHTYLGLIKKSKKFSLQVFPKQIFQHLTLYFISFYCLLMLHLEQGSYLFGSDVTSAKVQSATSVPAKSPEVLKVLHIFTCCNE